MRDYQGMSVACALRDLPVLAYANDIFVYLISSAGRVAEVASGDHCYVYYHICMCSISVSISWGIGIVGEIWRTRTVLASLCR